MGFLGFVLLLVGIIGLIAGWIWSLRLAFRQNEVYGVACLLIPIVMLFFLLTNLKRTWIPTLILVGGLIAVVGGGIMTKY